MDDLPAAEAVQARRPPKDSAKPYVVPFALYVVATLAAARAAEMYALAYSGAVLAVAVAAWLLLRGRGTIVPHWRVLEAVGIGLAGIAVWIGLSTLRLEDQIADYLPSWLQPGARRSFNPFDELAHPALAWTFIAVRLAGLSVLVPVVEELFWRGFLLRWFISGDWQDVPLGKFTLTSFLLVTLLFTLAHPEWLAAASYCMLLNGLLYWKRDLWSCIVAHGVSNLVLGIYVLSTGAWWLW